MKVDMPGIMELVRKVKPLFSDQEEAARIKVKGVADFVTQVDLRVQEMMCEGLGKMYPDIQFMGEEKDNSSIDFSGAVWILDPVDGTTNLIHDYRSSALSLGLSINRRMELAHVACGRTDAYFERILRPGCC